MVEDFKTKAEDVKQKERWDKQGCQTFTIDARETKVEFKKETVTRIGDCPKCGTPGQREPNAKSPVEWWFCKNPKCPAEEKPHRWTTLPK